MLFNFVAAYLVFLNPASHTLVGASDVNNDRIELPPPPPPPPMFIPPPPPLTSSGSQKEKSEPTVNYQINVYGTRMGSLFQTKPNLLPSEAADIYMEANKKKQDTPTKIDSGKNSKVSFLGQKGLKYGVALSSLMGKLETENVTKAIEKFAKLLERHSSKLNSIPDQTLKALELGDDELSSISDLESVQRLKKANELADPDIWVLQNKQLPHVMPMLKSLNYQRANKEYIEELTTIIQGVNGTLSSESLNEFMENVMTFAYTYIATIHHEVNPSRKLGRGIRIKEFLSLNSGKFNVFEDIVRKAKTYPKISGLSRDLIEKVVQLHPSKYSISLASISEGVSKAEEAIKFMRERIGEFKKSHKEFASKSETAANALESDLKRLKEQKTKLESLVKDWSDKLGDQSEDASKISENLAQFLGNIQELAEKWLKIWDKVPAEVVKKHTGGRTPTKAESSFDKHTAHKPVFQELQQRHEKSKGNKSIKQDENEDDETEPSTQEEVVVEEEGEQQREKTHQPSSRQKSMVNESEELSKSAPTKRKIELVGVTETMIDTVRNRMAVWEQSHGSKLLKN